MNSYEEILERCLGNIKSDTREGSFIHTAVAPVCMELSKAYVELSSMLDLSFVQTAFEDYLDKVLLPFGVVRRGESKCQKRANIKSNTDILGERFSAGNYIFIVREQIGDDLYIIEAENSGILYNDVLGELYSILNLDGIEYAHIVDNYILATEKEDDESLRTRFLERVLSKPFCGNISDYKDKAMSIEGVCFVKVFTACQMGEQNVHLVLANEKKLPVANDIISKAEKVFCGDGRGVGIAPIGHYVSIGTVETCEVDIKCKIIISPNANKDNVISTAREGLESFFKEFDFEVDIISNIKIMANLLLDQHILDVESVCINGLEQSFGLSKKYDCYQIAILRGVEIEEVQQ